jgi:hypothetical protein
VWREKPAHRDDGGLSKMTVFCSYISGLNQKQGAAARFGMRFHAQSTRSAPASRGLA